MKTVVGVLGYQNPGAEETLELTGGIYINSIKDIPSCDILVFLGGHDVSPELYNELNLYSDTDPKRDEFELKCLAKATALGIKVLGICRGHQFINAALGGSLYQDIVAQAGIDHSQRNHYDVARLWAVPSLADLFPRINSFHHQAVRYVGKGLTPILRTVDSIIESTANKEGTIVTFQFHPEWGNIGNAYFKKVVETGNLIW